jgi:hypothetical protein
MISDKLVYLNDTKTAIKNAIEAKGVTVGEATFREYATKVSEISAESLPSWRDPDWVDIENYYDTNYNGAGVWTPAYTYRTFALIAASDNETVLPAGFDYQTSDGVWYTGFTGATHIWDKTKDFVDSIGNKYRWIGYYRNTELNFVAGVTPNFNRSLLWVVDGIDRSSGIIRGSSTANNTYDYSNNFSLRCINFKNNLVEATQNAFQNCYSLKTILKNGNENTLGNIYTRFTESALRNCTSFEKCITDGTSLSDTTNGCWSLKNLILTQTITGGTSSALSGMFSLEKIDFSGGFNANGRNISSSTLLSAETLYSGIILRLADRSLTTTFTFTIGATNLEKLTPSQIAVATSKNWTLS